MKKIINNLEEVYVLSANFVKYLSKIGIERNPVGRKNVLSVAEYMTLILLKQDLGIRKNKTFYFLIQTFFKTHFSTLPSYQQFNDGLRCTLPYLLLLTNTILNHVKIIRDLVSHFSEFAQMPSNNMEPMDLNNTIKEVTCLYQLSYPEINFEYEFQEFIPLLKIDKKKIKRVIINLLDNSIRALKHIEEKSEMEKLSFKQNKKIITRLGA